MKKNIKKISVLTGRGRWFSLTDDSQHQSWILSRGILSIYPPLKLDLIVRTVMAILVDLPSGNCLVDRSFFTGAAIEKS